MLWKIPVTWDMCAYIKVEAGTLEEAMKIAEDPNGKIPLPTDGTYVDGSWSLSSTDRDEIAILQEPAQTTENHAEAPTPSAQNDLETKKPTDSAPAPAKRCSMDEILAYQLPGFYLDCRGVYGIMVCTYYISCFVNEEDGRYYVLVNTFDKQGVFSVVEQCRGFDTAKDTVVFLCSMVRSYTHIFTSDLLDEFDETYGGRS